MIGTRSYSDFSRGIGLRALEKRIPISGTIEVSHRCPLDCKHCYNNLPMSDEARARELSYDEYCRILDELADAGCMWLLFTGGEVFARRDFLDIYTYAKQKGFFITIFTNGTLVTQKVVDHLKKWPPFSIEITLYGHSKETYEALTSIPGSFEKCIRGIHLLQENALPLKLKTVAVQSNEHEVESMQRFAREQLGLEFKLDGMINPRTNGFKGPLLQRLDAEQLVAAEFADTAQAQKWKDFSKSMLGPANPPEKEKDIYSCGGGLRAFAIDPYGKLSICVLSQKEHFDLREGSFKEGWESFLKAVRSKQQSRTTKCTHCQIKAVCGMCPANGELEHDDPEEPVEFMCRVAHLRSLVVGLEVPSHGSCEYCSDGEHFQDILAAAGRIVRGESKKRLPLASGESTIASCGSGACGSCA
ncbi:MAG: radical SAM protein [Myxococcales bacterium]|nr:MAG: radical SAM protein [Myxococcales bacterium]